MLFYCVDVVATYKQRCFNVQYWLGKGNKKYIKLISQLFSDFVWLFGFFIFFAIKNTDTKTV